LSSPIYVASCRFGFFCGAALEYLRVRNVQPDILHCHDWQSATASWGERPNNAKVAFTIHNLNYGADLVGRAMATCEVATTVSPTYAREVSLVVLVVGQGAGGVRVAAA
jgi:starch synthase